ncbi:MAG: Asp-tRNA(Asn)/Glu-tRNA(Gln) amidotransferase subunit GatC [Puniceicoccales bacterium]|jgi:aspartyl-tRNA(Asn)/glutamyl-tRNA(Gln) amidotransferase subunit C|nr:Asp-tRNA(Asn)/Glu-tRNA(Gln) amidotransferase subunit GatC [Puniceicoccales bacterium]
MSAPATKPVTLDIEYLSKLARIALTETEKTRLAGELGAVIGYFDELAGIATDGVEPSAHAFPVHSVLREDAADAATMLDAAALEAVAPAFRDGQVLVPRVVDDAG